MDFKIPELKFNIGGKIIGGLPRLKKKKRIQLLQQYYKMNQFNARNHGEGGCYSKEEPPAQAINIKQQKFYLAQARMKRIPFLLADPINPDNKYQRALSILIDIGDALHIAQDRGAHGEGAKGKGHAGEIMTGKDPDTKRNNKGGYIKAETNTSAVLNSVYRILSSIFGLKFFDHLWSKIKKGTQIIMRILKILKDKIKYFIKAIISVFKRIWRVVKSIIKRIINTIINIIKFVIRAVPLIIRKIITLVKRILRRIKAEANRILRKAVLIAKWLLYTTVSTVKKAVRYLIKKGKTIYHKTISGAKKVYNTVETGFKKVAHRTKQTVTKVKRIIIREVKKVKDTVVKAPEKIKRRIKSSIKWLVSPIF